MTGIAQSCSKPVAKLPAAGPSTTPAGADPHHPQGSPDQPRALTLVSHVASASKVRETAGLEPSNCAAHVAPASKAYHSAKEKAAADFLSKEIINKPIPAWKLQAISTPN